MMTLIMVVDDDLSVRESLLSVLSTYGYRTCAFASARAALQDIPDLKPDCTVLDVRMPEVDGIQMLGIL